MFKETNINLTKKSFPHINEENSLPKFLIFSLDFNKFLGVYFFLSLCLYEIYS